MKKTTYPMFYANKQMRFARACVAGNLVFMAGVTARLLDTGQFDPAHRNDPAAQTKYAMQRVKEGLEGCGSSLENLLHLTIYCKDIQKNGRAILDTYIDFLKEQAPSLVDNWPAETIVGIDSLFAPDALVEIQPIAIISDDKQKPE